MPGKKPKPIWPVLLMLMLTDEDIVRDIIERVRDEFHMAAPADKACVALNRGPEAHFPAKRERLLARVEELCGETVWKGDLDWVHVMFHPEESVEEARPTTEDLAELPPFTRMLTEMFFEILPKAMQQVGYGTIKYRIVHWLTDYAIHGDYIEIKPMPVLFDTNIIELPFYEDKLIVALVSRATEMEPLIDQLRIRRRQAFVKRRSNTDPENIERNAWVWVEYHRIKASSHARKRYGLLLDAFLSSRWADQFDHYDLDTYEDQKRAQAALRKMVSRAKKHAQDILPDQPALFCDS